MKGFFIAVLKVTILWVIFIVSTETATCQGPNKAPKINSPRRTGEGSQSVSAKKMSIFLSCSITNTKFLAFTLKALKLLLNLMTSTGNAHGASWFPTFTRYSIEERPQIAA